MLLDQVCELQHQLASVCRRQLLPGRVLEGLASGLDSHIDIVGSGSVHRRNFRLVPAEKELSELRQKLPRLAPATYVGFMDVIFSPDFDLTNSLLMNSPIGWVYLRPLGAVNSTKRSDMIRGELENFRLLKTDGTRSVNGDVRVGLGAPRQAARRRQARGVRPDIYIRQCRLADDD